MTRRAKYGNTKVKVDGITFDSKAEAKRYGELKLLERGKAIGDLRLQPEFHLFGKGGTKICKYRADFQYVDLCQIEGVTVVEDVKGMKTPVYRLKAKLFKDNYGFAISEVSA